MPRIVTNWKPCLPSPPPPPYYFRVVELRLSSPDRFVSNCGEGFMKTVPGWAGMGWARPGPGAMARSRWIRLVNGWWKEQKLISFNVRCLSCRPSIHPHPFLSSPTCLLFFWKREWGENKYSCGSKDCGARRGRRVLATGKCNITPLFSVF